MDEGRIEQILKNTKFSMEMEGFTIDAEHEKIGYKILSGEIELQDYIESVKQRAWRHVHEV